MIPSRLIVTSLSALVFAACAQPQKSAEYDFVESSPITQSQVDAHQKDLPWLTAAVRSHFMESPLAQRCGFYLMASECKVGRSLGEIGRKTSAMYWLDTKVCRVARQGIALGGQMPISNGEWLGYIAFRIKDGSEPAVWVGLSAEVSKDEVYFALGHPDSKIANQVYVTDVFVDK